MIDVIGAGVRAAATHSTCTLPLLFAAGALTSIGPCAAPRFIAVAALANAPRAGATIAAFGGGLVSAYVALGAAAGAAGTLWSFSRVTYAVLAAALAAAGIVTLLRARARTPHACSDRSRAAGSSLGAAFLLGASNVFVVAPCCTPVVAALAALTTAGGAGIAPLTAFACGHALPVLAAGAAGARIAPRLGAFSASGAPAVVGGGLLLALAAYYGVLA